MYILQWVLSIKQALLIIFITEGYCVTVQIILY